MADSARKDKIAAAKKRLKQFQKTGKTPTNSPAPPEKRNKLPKDDIHSKGPSQKEGKNELGSPPEAASAMANHVHSPESHASGNPSLPTNSVPSHNHQPGLDQEDAAKRSRPSPGDAASSTDALTPHTSHHASSNHGNRLTGSTERLQQLSRQINGLIGESNSHMNNDGSTAENSSITDLETRNQELASLLAEHTQANQQLEAQLQDLKKHNSRLQQNLETEKKGFEERLKRELGALKEQLQVHIQTIGILVAEKTELQSSLNQSHKSVEQRLEEIEELSGRLKASRQRVADLERSFTSASGSSNKHEQSSKEYSKEVDRLKMDLYKLNKSNEEFQQKNSELQGKLQKKLSEHGKAEDEIIELRGKLEMTELYVQQLQNGSEKSDSTSSAQIEQLLEEKGEMAARLDQYENSFQKVSSERDQISKQYQEYIEQLQHQAQNLQVQINTLVGEKEQVLEQYQTLQEVTQQMKSNQDTAEQEATEGERQRSQLREEVGRLQDQLSGLSKTHETQAADNSQLSRLVIEKEQRIMELEMSVQRISDSHIDQEKILESMQSDKTALSRAMAQNKELKSQLGELQNGFVKMSNDNMELLSQLQGEQHISGELGARLSQQEQELKEIRDQLLVKEHRLLELEKIHQDEPQHAELTAEEIDKKLAEFREQSPLVETLQRELASAQDTINALTNQNSELRTQLVHSESTDNVERDSDTSKTQVENMSASVRQLEMERNEVIAQLKEEQRERRAGQDKLQQLQTELATQTPATLNGDVINKPQFEALQHAMQQLEGKFSKAMRDKADLSDKTEQLEHIIMQLQGETETIGEYVTLYQQQRSILRARTTEKDEYISRLAREREEMADKLGQLQALVMQLLGERQMLHSYHINNNEVAKTAGNHLAAASPNPGLHAATGPDNKHFGAKLDSSNLEDWPDYTSSSGDSDTSEVEPIVAGQGVSGSTEDKLVAESTTNLAPPSEWNFPQEEHTAQRIMNLLTEIGTSNLVERTLYADNHFLHCLHCKGRILHV